MKIWGIVRNAANLIVARYANNALCQPNLTDKGNVAVEQILTGPAGLVPTVADIDDGLITTDQTVPLVIAENYISNGADWVRQRAIPDNADAQAPLTANLAGAVVRLQAWNGAAFDRVRSGANNAEDISPVATGLIGTQSFGLLYNGGNFDRHQSASATNQGVFSALGVALVAFKGNWSIQNDPAVNVQATITRAAGGAFLRNICTSISAHLSSGATASGLVKVYLRDGAAGAGAILWSGNLTVPVAGNAKVILSGLSIVGSLNTAMTLEFSAAGGLTTQENVSLTGYDAT